MTQVSLESSLPNDNSLEADIARLREEFHRVQFRDTRSALESLARAVPHTRAATLALLAHDELHPLARFSVIRELVLSRDPSRFPLLKAWIDACDAPILRGNVAQLLDWFLHSEELTEEEVLFCLTLMERFVLTSTTVPETEFAVMTIAHVALRSTTDAAGQRAIAFLREHLQGDLRPSCFSFRPSSDDCIKDRDFSSLPWDRYCVLRWRLLLLRAVERKVRFQRSADLHRLLALFKDVDRRELQVKIVADHLTSVAGRILLQVTELSDEYAALSAHLSECTASAEVSGSVSYTSNVAAFLRAEAERASNSGEVSKVFVHLFAEAAYRLETSVAIRERRFA
jgi:hypothetical protein